MSRMFCTLKEAAETLNASEDQLLTLLERGILHEFRVGPHRLLKEADVSAVASVGAGRAKAQPAASSLPGVQRSSPSLRANPEANRSAAAIAQSPGSRPTDTGKPGTAGRQGRTEDRGLRAEKRSPRAMSPSGLGRPSGAPRRRGGVPARRPLPSPPRLSVRQWFWIGLIQDRPMVIALLSGLVLLGLSALAAGLCFVAETL